MERIPMLLKDEKGIALVVALLFLTLLSLLGIAGIITSSTDTKIAGNNLSSVKAFYNAEAGAIEVRIRLKGSQPSDKIIKDPNYPDSKWSAYILTSASWTTSDDPDYTSYNTASYRNYIPTSTSQTNTTVKVNSLQSGISYWVKVKHKTEYDAEQEGHTTSKPHYNDLDGNTAGGHTLASPGSIIYYGYRSSSSTTMEEFTSSSTPSTTLAEPVEIIRAYGSSGSSVKVVEIQVRRTRGAPVVGALYGNSIGGNGNVTVDGRDNCATSGNVPALAYFTSQTLWPGGSVTCLPAGNEQTLLAAPIDLAERVNTLQAKATDILTADKTNYTVGTSTDYRIVYCNADALSPDSELDINNLTGYGTLLVRGDVSFSGTIEWHGIIIASGNVEFSGGGTRNIYGAVLANSTATLQGTVNITYDAFEVKKANDSMPPLISRWREDTGS
jgi:Tfp pilus assembly protein PilX